MHPNTLILQSAWMMIGPMHILVRLQPVRMEMTLEVTIRSGDPTNPNPNPSVVQTEGVRESACLRFAAHSVPTVCQSLSPLTFVLSHVSVVTAFVDSP